MPKRITILSPPPKRHPSEIQIHKTSQMPYDLGIKSLCYITSHRHHCVIDMHDIYRPAAKFLCYSFCTFAVLPIECQVVRDIFKDIFQILVQLHRFAHQVLLKVAHDTFHTIAREIIIYAPLGSNHDDGINILPD